MSQPQQRPHFAAPTLRASLILFAAVDLGLALFMAVAPHAFYRSVGPYGVSNPHYVRDVASFYGAIGVALGLAVGRPSWRAPVLAVSTIQFALHSVNHLIDIGKAHPSWTGYANFASLLAGTLILAWLWRVAATAEHRAPARSEPRPRPTPERSFT